MKPPIGVWMNMAKGVTVVAGRQHGNGNNQGDNTGNIKQQSTVKSCGGKILVEIGWRLAMGVGKGKNMTDQLLGW